MSEIIFRIVKQHSAKIILVNTLHDDNARCLGGVETRFDRFIPAAIHRFTLRVGISVVRLQRVIDDQRAAETAITFEVVNLARTVAGDRSPHRS